MSSCGPKRVPLSRRHFLQGSAFAAGTLAAPAIVRAAPLKPVNVMLDWIYQGPNSGFMLAQEKGFYREAGLDVTITSGKGSASTAQLVASKATQFGFSDGYVVANGVAKGMMLKSVASIYRRNPATVIVPAESAIKSPKDLEGKTIAIAAGSTQFTEWPAFVKGAGIEGSKI